MISGEKLRVLRVSHTASLSTYRARERAFAKRHPVELAVVTAKDWPHLGLEPDEEVNQFDLHKAGTVLAGNVPLFAFDPRVLVNAIKSHRPHIVDIHQEPYSSAGFEATWLANRLAPDAPRIFCTAQNIEKKYPYPFRQTEQFVYKKCAAAYMCSQEAEHVLRRKGYRGITEIFPLGIDPSIYYPELRANKGALRSSLDIDQSSFLIGYFGRLEPYKGPQVLVDALSRLHAEGINSRLLIAGSGEYINDLRALGTNLGVADRIHFVGSLEASQTPNYIALCDVVAVPSLTTKTWKEQFGRVPVEAMACGVPVISSDSGSLPEVVEGVGLVVQENSTEALSIAIRQLFEDETSRNALIDAGLKKVQEQYTWDVIADRTYDLYCRVLNLKVCLAR